MPRGLSPTLEFDPLTLPLFKVFPLFPLDKGQIPQHNRRCSDGLAAAYPTRLISGHHPSLPTFSYTEPHAGLQTEPALSAWNRPGPPLPTPSGAARASGPKNLPFSEPTLSLPSKSEVSAPLLGPSQGPYAHLYLAHNLLFNNCMFPCLSLTQAGHLIVFWIITIPLFSGHS